MDEQNHIKLLRLQSAELTARTPFCPESQQIAEYFDGGLPPAERTTLEHHLTVCRFCLANIGMLERLEQDHDNKRIPEDLLAAAKQMVRPRPVRRFGSATVWAVAATLVIALFTTINGNRERTLPHGAIPDNSPPIEENSIQLRSVDHAANDIRVLTPPPRGDVVPGSIFAWDAVPGNLHYHISILSSDGDVLWSERLQDTDWALDGSLDLVAGAQYYFRVEAQLPDDRSVSSKHVVFRIAAKQ